MSGRAGEVVAGFGLGAEFQIFQDILDDAVGGGDDAFGEADAVAEILAAHPVNEEAGRELVERAAELDRLAEAEGIGRDEETGGNLILPGVEAVDRPGARVGGDRAGHDHRAAAAPQFHQRAPLAGDLADLDRGGDPRRELAGDDQPDGVVAAAHAADPRHKHSRRAVDQIVHGVPVVSGTARPSVWADARWSTASPMACGSAASTAGESVSPKPNDPPATVRRSAGGAEP